MRQRLASRPAPSTAPRPAPPKRASSGRALSSEERSFFEPRFGESFDDVRLHEDAGAAKALQARAYTAGSDIIFAPGRYDRRVLAHELAHTVQQRRAPLAPSIMRTWEAPQSGDCAAPPSANAWIDQIVVEQEEPQSVTVHWTDGTLEADQCSTGKGHCCVDPTTDNVACTREQSRMDNTNCTPVSETSGWPVINRVRDHGGVMFWSEINHDRAIALHEYAPVDGTPLSHGCIRLNTAMAKKIFCNVHQNATRVQVRAFARPRCDNTNLQAEWANDFATASRPPDGDETARGGHRAGEIREERRALQSAFGVTRWSDVASRIAPQSSAFTGVDLQGQAARVTAGAAIASLIPRCTTARNRPTVEERRGFDVTPAGGSVPAQLLNTSGFASRLVPFLVALRGASSLARATTVVTAQGESLWNAATARAQAATGADVDDRPLYWERLEMTRALRQWSPAFTMSEAQRNTLIATFERASRGMTTAAFPATLAAGTKRIVISGFDPFGFSGTARNLANPSGAAVLSLDGQTISSASATGHVEGVIFPVRYADFDAGMVESFFRPFLTSTPPVDMIMTISMGAPGDTNFEIEQYAGRNRGAFSDNLGAAATGTAVPGTTGLLAPPSSMPSGGEFTQTTLPAPTILANVPAGTNIVRDRGGAEIVPGAAAESDLGLTGPTPGSTSVRGSGGSFLSNEIMYRTTLLRDTNPQSSGRIIPVGHLHTPFLAAPGGGAATSSTFTTARDTIVRTVRRILEAALPGI